MSLCRIPPPSPSVHVTCESLSVLSAIKSSVSQSLLHCSSEPKINISSSIENLDCDSTTQRSKRKRSDCSDTQLTVLMAEMRIIFWEFRAQQLSRDIKIEQISVPIEDIKSQYVTMLSTADFLANEFDSIHCQIENTESYRTKKLQYVQTGSWGKIRHFGKY